MACLFTDDMDMEFSVRRTKCALNNQELAIAAGVVTNLKEVSRHLNQNSFNYKVAFEFLQMLNYMKQEQAWAFDKEAHWNKVISQLQHASVVV